MGLQGSMRRGPDPRTDRVQGRLDALMTLARVAPVTSHIGLVPTVTTTFTEPFHVSKAVATLDWVSTGRAGWRAQLSRAWEEPLFGRRPSLAEEDLFAEAADHVEVVRRLWDSLGGRRRDPRRRRRPLRRPGQAALRRLRGPAVLGAGPVDHAPPAAGPAGGGGARPHHPGVPVRRHQRRRRAHHPAGPRRGGDDPGRGPGAPGCRRAGRRAGPRVRRRRGRPGRGRRRVGRRPAGPARRDRRQAAAQRRPRPRRLGLRPGRHAGVARRRRRSAASGSDRPCCPTTSRRSRATSSPSCSAAVASAPRTSRRRCGACSGLPRPANRYAAVRPDRRPSPTEAGRGPRPIATPTASRTTAIAPKRVGIRPDRVTETQPTSRTAAGRRVGRQASGSRARTARAWASGSPSAGVRTSSGDVGAS